MSIKSNEDAEGNNPMDRRIIQLGNLPDQAGIAAALRRAFAARPSPAQCLDENDLAALLRKIH